MPDTSLSRSFSHSLSSCALSVSRPHSRQEADGEPLTPDQITELLGQLSFRDMRAPVLRAAMQHRLVQQFAADRAVDGLAERVGALTRGQRLQRLCVLSWGALCSLFRA
jgi:hypothetical protein